MFSDRFRVALCTCRRSPWCDTSHRARSAGRRAGGEGLSCARRCARADGHDDDGRSDRSGARGRVHPGAQRDHRGETRPPRATEPEPARPARVLDLKSALNASVAQVRNSGVDGTHADVHELPGRRRRRPRRLPLHQAADTSGPALRCDRGSAVFRRAVLTCDLEIRRMTDARDVLAARPGGAGEPTPLYRWECPSRPGLESRMSAPPRCRRRAVAGRTNTSTG